MLIPSKGSLAGQISIVVPQAGSLVSRLATCSATAVSTRKAEQPGYLPSSILLAVYYQEVEGSNPRPPFLSFLIGQQVGHYPHNASYSPKLVLLDISLDNVYPQRPLFVFLIP